jgi:acyl-coenzyme A thioesterase PaaI-like protein
MDVSMPTTDDDDRLARRRSAVEDLGAAVRALVQVTVETEVDDPVLFRAGQLARTAAGLLAERVRPAEQLAAVDRVEVNDRVVRMYSPVLGPGNPISPPVSVVHTDPDIGELEAICELHRTHEGPPSYGHGGVSALLLDQLLGNAVALRGRIGLTRSLEVTYHRPVPLGQPLRLIARAEPPDGTRMRSTGEITTAAAPDVVLVSAVGTFLIPRPDQVARLFGHLRPAEAARQSGD